MKKADFWTPDHFSDREINIKNDTHELNPSNTPHELITILWERNPHFETENTFSNENLEAFLQKMQLSYSEETLWEYHTIRQLLEENIEDIKNKKDIIVWIIRDINDDIKHSYERAKQHPKESKLCKQDIQEYNESKTNFQQEKQKIIAELKYLLEQKKRLLNAKKEICHTIDLDIDELKKNKEEAIQDLEEGKKALHQVLSSKDSPTTTRDPLWEIVFSPETQEDIQQDNEKILQYINEIQKKLDEKSFLKKLWNHA